MFRLHKSKAPRVAKLRGQTESKFHRMSLRLPVPIMYHISFAYTRVHHKTPPLAQESSLKTCYYRAHFHPSGLFRAFQSLSWGNDKNLASRTARICRGILADDKRQPSYTVDNYMAPRTRLYMGAGVTRNLN